MTLALLNELKELCPYTREVCNFEDRWSFVKVLLQERNDKLLEIRI